MIDHKQNGKRNNDMDRSMGMRTVLTEAILMMTTIQPIDKVLIKVHRTHHPPVDVPISTRDGW